MNSLDRIVKKENTRRYKRLKKLFKARDMASMYISKPVLISKLDSYFRSDDHYYHTTGFLAKRIVKEHRRILGIAVRPSNSIK